MKTNKFYKIIIVVLILINLGTLFFFWKGHRGPGRPDKNQLVEMLNLTGDTKTKILELQDDHFKKKEALIKRSRNLHESLFQSFNDKSKDSTDIKMLIDKIVENQRETEQMTFDYFKVVNSMCTPDQQKKLQELIHNVLRQAGGPPHPPKK
jgi:Spy/CpxP family protein refolding chaperone